MFSYKNYSNARNHMFSYIKLLTMNETICFLVRNYSKCTKPYVWQYEIVQNTRNHMFSCTILFNILENICFHARFFLKMHETICCHSMDLNKMHETICCFIRISYKYTKPYVFIYGIDENKRNHMCWSRSC